MTPEEIFLKAEAAAFEAAKAENAKLPPEQQRGLDCGFAWVTIRPARGKFVSYLRKEAKEDGSRYGDLAYGGGWQIWCTRFAPTQSVTVHEAAARAMAEVFKANGLDASMNSRLD